MTWLQITSVVALTKGVVVLTIPKMFCGLPGFASSLLYLLEVGLTQIRGRPCSLNIWYSLWLRVERPLNLHGHGPLSWMWNGPKQLHHCLFPKKEVVIKNFDDLHLLVKKILVNSSSAPCKHGIPALKEKYAHVTHGPTKSNQEIV